MAGDWIKMRTDLANDPAVIGTAAALQLEEDTVVGKLHRLWSWANAHTVNGLLRGASYAWVNAFLRVENFSETLEKFGWMARTDDGIRIVRFKRHNGKSGKRRAVAQNSMRKLRGKKRCAKGATKAQPEKRREEILKPGSGKQAARQTGRTAPAEPGGEPARTSSSGAPALKTPEKPAGSQRTSRSNAQPAASAGTGRVLSTGNGSGQPRGQPTGREPGQTDKRAAEGAKPPPACTSRDGTGGIWKRVTEELLRDDRALLEWTRDATERAIVESCDATALRIFGVAERALELGTKPAAFFVSLVKAGDWTKTSNEQEERGRRRLAALRAKSTGPPAGSLAAEYLQDAGRLPAYANVKHPR